MVRLFFALICATLVSSAALAADLHYKIEPHPSAPVPYLQVSLTFRGEVNGHTFLELPYQWANESEYYRGIRNVVGTSPRTNVSPTDTPYRMRIDHPPGASVTVQYQVFRYWDDPITHEVYYRPLIESDYFHFIGYGVFAHPEPDSPDVISIQLEWANVPKAWALANSFGVAEKNQMISARLRDFKHAVYTGGDFRVKSFEIEGYPLHVAVRGEWQFSLDAFYDLAKIIVQNGREFWQDYEFPFFLITMIPTDAEGNSTGGTGLTDSFALFAGKEVTDINRFKFLLTHELFHTWNGRKIQRVQPEALIYWFSEGFTNYYTRLLNLRAGLITLDQYVQDLNSVIEQYYVSPVRNESNQRVLEDFWNDRHVKDLPYLRGDLVAHQWNLKFKQQTPGASLDSLMFDLLAEATTIGTLVSPTSLDRMSRPYYSPGIRDEITRYIEVGETVNIAAEALGPCFSLTTKVVGRPSGGTVDVPQYTIDPAADLDICSRWFQGVR